MSTINTEHTARLRPPARPGRPSSLRTTSSSSSIHKKPRDDGFQSLANASDPSTKCAAGNNEEPDDQPVIVKILLTPLLFVSFLLSLTYINRRQRAYRSAEHPSGAPCAACEPGVWERVAGWVSPEPYQNASGDAGSVKSTSSGGLEHEGKDGSARKAKSEKQRWYARKKKWAMARLQLGDAFELSVWVLMWLVGAWVAVIALVGWGVWKLVAA